MTVSYNENRGKLEIELFGELGHHEAIDAMENIAALYECIMPIEVILDMGGVSFMDSSGIGLIMGRYRLASGYGARVSITEASGYIKRVIKIAGLDSIVSLNQNTDTQLSNKEETKIEK